MRNSATPHSAVGLATAPGEHDDQLLRCARCNARGLPVLTSSCWLVRVPLDTQKVVIDNQAREEFVAPSLALGLRASALSVDVFAASRLELQLGTLAGVTIGSSSGDVVFPLLAGRLHFSNQSGFALYLGSAYAFRRDTVALLYGIGHRF